MFSKMLNVLESYNWL